jgi:hypothetical protein
VPVRCKWEPPEIEPWEGPFFDPTHRLPQHPIVAAERREAKRRYRLRSEMREREAVLAKERRIQTDFPTSAGGDASGTPRHTLRQQSELTAEIIAFPEGKRP